MSVLIMSDKKLNKCASSLVYNNKYYPNTNVLDHKFYEVFGLNGYMNNIDDLTYEVGRFIKEIALSNHRAYEQRYNDFIAFRYPLIVVDGHNTFPNACALLKCLECVRYNSDFSNDPTTAKRLDALIKIIGKTIIEQLPDYKNADWE